MQQRRDIAHILWKEKLVMDVDLRTDIDRLTLTSSEKFKSHKTCLLIAKTKGLLLNDIYKLIREHYPDGLAELYALPIVHIDSDQSELPIREL